MASHDCPIHTGSSALVMVLEEEAVRPGGEDGKGEGSVIEVDGTPVCAAGARDLPHELRESALGVFDGLRGCVVDWYRVHGADEAAICQSCGGGGGAGEEGREEGHFRAATFYQHHERLFV
jgi:hypothetical protein